MRRIVGLAGLFGALALPAAVPTPQALLSRALRAEAEGKAKVAAQDAARVVVDAPASEAALSASALLGRLRLREGAYGEAAWWLERALAGGAKAGPHLAPLRALAVRSLLRQQGMGGAWAGLQDVAATEVRRPAGLLRLPTGERVLLDTRAGALVWIAPDGAVRRTVLGDPQAAALDASGKVVVAAGEQVVVVDPAHPEIATAFGALGRFAPVAALAVDAQGFVWVADRKGSRVGRLAAGAAEPVPIFEAKAVRVEAMAALGPGQGMAVLDTRAGALAVLDRQGDLHPRPALPWGERGRPVALAADAAGQIAVLDGRTGEVLLLDAAGGVRDRLPAPEADRDSPVALALGPDGSLDVVTADGRLRRSP